MAVRGTELAEDLETELVGERILPSERTNVFVVDGQSSGMQASGDCFVSDVDDPSRGIREIVNTLLETDAMAVMRSGI